MIDFILSILGYKRVYTIHDQMYKNLQLKDFGVEMNKHINDKELWIFIVFNREDLEEQGINIPEEAHKNFTLKHFWLSMIKAHNYFIYSVILTMLFSILAFIFSLWIALGVIAIGTIITIYSRKNYIKACDNYSWWYNMRDFEDSLKENSNKT